MNENQDEPCSCGGQGKTAREVDRSGLLFGLAILGALVIVLIGVLGGAR